MNEFNCPHCNLPMNFSYSNEILTYYFCNNINCEPIIDFFNYKDEKSKLYYNDYSIRKYIEGDFNHCSKYYKLMLFS